MKILVLGGSPKGETSVTMQYVNYIRALMPEHEFKTLQISRRIRKLEINEQAFSEVIDEVRAADGVLWAFPLYVLLVPSQYKRFVELIWERGVQSAFKGKYAAVVTTSIHFFDHTAHSYMRAICDDLEMSFAGSFSPEMHDLQNPDGQMKTRQFGTSFVTAMEKRISIPRQFSPVVPVDFEYAPGPVNAKTELHGKNVVILHDAREGQTNLQAMIERLRTSFDGQVQVHNLHEVNIKAGCLGCLKCGQNYECTYTGKDEFIEFYTEKIKPADILIYAGAISDRFLSSRWRMFFDRGFFNCHTPSLTNKQFGFVISGPLSQIGNIREVLEGYVQWQRSNVVDFVSDEVADSGQLDAQLSGLANRLEWNSRQQYISPRTFLGVGGHKIFRDDIFSNLRFVFQADHRYFKKNGLYDFPQKKIGLRAMNILLGLLFRVPKIRRKFDRVVKQKMMEPHRKVVESVSR
jgi:multimeric flavodoxin WrbA